MNPSMVAEAEPIEEIIPFRVTLEVEIDEAVDVPREGGVGPFSVSTFRADD